MPHADTWHYRKGTNAPQPEWKTMDEAGLDATWRLGAGGIGYAGNTPETADCATKLTDMRNSYSSVYLRRTFAVAENPAAELHLFLRMDWDDGFIAWLDGVYLGSRNVTGAPAEPKFGDLASAGHESSRGDSSPEPAEILDLGLAAARLPAGAHTLAILGLNRPLDSSDFILVPDLYFGLPGGGSNGTNEFSGVLTTNTTFFLTNSPITITATLTINPGVTLTIEPGVTVKLAPNASLIVEDGGRLLAEGTGSDRIQFTRASALADWNNLVVKGSPGSPESRITYTHLEGNNTTAIHAAGGTVWLDHLTFGTTTHPYFAMDAASFVISHCSFPNATAAFEPGHGTDGIKPGGHGIIQRNFFGTAIGYSDIVDFTGGNRPGQSVVHFLNNVFMGSGDDAVDLDGTDAWVEGNIFLHFHKNGSPDSSSAISGGSYNFGTVGGGTQTSQITALRNLFFDCDQAATAKQGNFYVLLHNTVVHQTHSGGLDVAGAVVNLSDEGTTEALGMYLEGNIAFDVEALQRGATNATATFINNLLPVAWTGAGGGNTIDDPQLKHIPQVAEAAFTNWQEAQVMWDWFSLNAGSPAIGTGLDGLDQGAGVPPGVWLTGEPATSTTETSATIHVGPNRKGNPIPLAGWPLGSGYTHYRWRLDGVGDWSAETPINTAISLAGLLPGPHFVEVSGQRDTGLYQDDPLFGEDATTTKSRTWTITTSDTDHDGMPDDWETAHNLLPNDASDATLDPDGDGMTNRDEFRAGTDPRDGGSRLALTISATAEKVSLAFVVQPARRYEVQTRLSLDTGAWQPVVELPLSIGTEPVTLEIPRDATEPKRLFRLVLLAAP